MEKVFVMLIGAWSSIALAQNKSSIDFIQEIDVEYFYALRTNSKGVISARDAYQPEVDKKKVEGNPHGKIYLYMIHKDGGQYWRDNEISKAAYDCPSRFYGKCDKYNDRIGTARLLVEDKAKLVEFVKWVFFIDKQYLEPFTEQVEGGAYTGYYTKDNSSFEVILYLQLPNEVKWVEIERRTVDNNQFFNWKLNFIKSKSQEYR